MFKQETLEAGGQAWPCLTHAMFRPEMGGVEEGGWGLQEQLLRSKQSKLIQRHRAPTKSVLDFVVFLHSS